MKKYSEMTREELLLEKEALEKAKKDAEAADEQAVQPSLTDTSGGSAAAESNKGGSQRLDNVLNNNLIMGGVFGIGVILIFSHTRVVWNFMNR